MARRRSSSTYTGSNFRRPGWMVFITVGISLVNAIVRVVKMIAAWRKSRAAAAPKVGQTDPPRAPQQPAAAPTATPTSARPGRPGRGVVPAPPVVASSAVGSDGGIPDLFKQQRSDVIVQASGLIVKVLPDETDTTDGSEQHQKFLVELVDRARTTIKICHNLKFGRVPAREGQVVTFRGEYEYNDRGGSVHWTHHDPIARHEDGWLEIEGQRYG